MSEHVHEQQHHDPHDRSGARAMFIELRKLPDGSPERAELRNQLVRMHLPLVEHLARRFRNRGEPLDDLTQVATIGLIKSVDRFDPERGVEFSTYATPTVVGEIKRHFRDKGWAVRVPRRLQELRLVADHGHGGAVPAARPLPHGPRAGRAPGHLGGGGPGGPGVRQRVQHAVPGRPRHGRRVPGGGGHAGRGGRGAGGRRVPGVPQAAAGGPAAAGEADPAAAVLRQHDPVADRAGGRHLADARLPAAGPHPGAAPRQLLVEE